VGLKILPVLSIILEVFCTYLFIYGHILSSKAIYLEGVYRWNGEGYGQ